MSIEGRLGRAAWPWGAAEDQGVVGWELRQPQPEQGGLLHAANAHPLLLPREARGGPGGRWWAKPEGFPTLLEDKSRGEIDLNPTPWREGQVESVRRALSYKDM